MANQVVEQARSAPYNGPFDLSAVLIDQAVAAGVEGIWIDSGFAKAHSIEMIGSGTIGVDLYGSNAPDMPPNQYAVTIGGSATQNDVISLIFANQNLAGGTRTVAYTVPATPSINGIAAGIATAVNADAALKALGFSASAANAVITISFPSAPLGSSFPPVSPSAPAMSNVTVLTSTLSGGASETVAIVSGTNGTKIGSTINALGLTAISVLPRWLTARLTTLSGGSAVLSANWHGVG